MAISLQVFAYKLQGHPRVVLAFYGFLAFTLANRADWRTRCTAAGAGSLLLYPTF
jgi:hypothetical protein